MSWGQSTCVICFDEYEKTTKNQQTCSPKCRRVHAAKRPNKTAERKRLKRIARKKLYGI